VIKCVKDKERSIIPKSPILGSEVARYFIKINYMEHKVQFESTLQVIDSVADLNDKEREAVTMAMSMIDKAYAPYSNFYVGAAAVTASGTVYPGCNQENASYPLCICGERVALYNAGAHEHDVPVVLLAIVCSSRDKAVPRPVSPCGACRQVITEFEDRHDQPITILLKADGDTLYKSESGAKLLPFLFDASVL